jgi:hypothetical protein
MSTGAPISVSSLARQRLPSTANLSLLECQHRPLVRWLSTEVRAQTAAAAAANAAMANEASGGKSGAKKKNEPNLFLDNLGKIFLFSIGAVIVTLVRSSYNTTNRHEVRDRLEEIAAIDPKEFEDFREANSELTIDVMRHILSIYYREFSKTSGGENLVFASSYDEFVIAIRTIMATRFPKQGESFTIELGHFLDRIILAVLERRGEGAPMAENDGLPVALFFAALASAVNGSLSDRIRILHEILIMEEQERQLRVGAGMTLETSTNGALATNSIPLARVRDMVGYLQDTCQLPPDTQIVPTEQKYPTQQWRRATPSDMLPDVSESEGEPEDGEKDVDLVEFAAILRTKSVCAWGECYMRWKPDASEFETPAPGGGAETSISN